MPPRSTIGQMRHRVIVNTYGDAPFGEYSLQRSYTPVATVRARVTNISGSASREGKALDANITHVIVIRKPAFVITTENILEWIHGASNLINAENDDDIITEAEDALITELTETNEYLRIRQMRPVGRTTGDPRNQFVMLLCEMQGEVDAFEDPSPETA